MALNDNFTLKEVETGLYLCRERDYISWNKANIWIFQGTTLDVIIDTGIGLWNLPEYLKSSKIIGDRPVLAVATHIHFDHTGGIHQFDDCGIHEAEADALAAGDQYLACSAVRNSDLAKKPYIGFSPENYKVKAVRPSRVLKDGDIIDQGNRQLHVLHTPGHTKGSICLFEPNEGVLFTGDTIYDSILLDFVPTSCIPDYVDSCHKLKEICPKLKIVCPGHLDALSPWKFEHICNRYIEGATSIARCWRGCLKCLFCTTIKGRNTNNIPAKCFYYGCCCCCCL